MYDDDHGYLNSIDPDRWDRWARTDDSWPRRDRLTHVILIDGRFVESWTEDVEETRWAPLARAIDEREQPRPVFAQPEPPPHDVALEWLDSLVGGRTRLEALDAEPLPSPGTIDVSTLPLASRHRVEAAVRALDAAADEFWDDDVRRALQTAFRALWTEDESMALRARSAAHVAGGICWLVGRANELFGAGRVTQSAVQKQLGLPTTLSACGTSIHQSLRGLQPPYGRQPYGQPDLLATGRAEFLVSPTRARLIRVRDQALAMRDQFLADEALKERVLP